MRNINLKKVVDIAKEHKKQIWAIFIGVLAVILIFTIYNFYKTKQIEKAKQEIKIQDLEKSKEILEENKDEIFFINETKTNKQKKNTISSEIEYLKQELESLNRYDNCIENQLTRLLNSKDVDLNYCKKEDSQEKEPILEEVKKIKESKPTPLEKKEIKKETKKVSYKNTDDEVIIKAMDVIKKYEGVRYTAYRDHGQYSICFGTKSYKGATATHEECEKLLKDRVKNELARINQKASGIDTNKKVALISFFYNVWYKDKVINYAKKWDDKSVVYLIGLYSYADGKYLPWLQKRRQAEIKIYNS